MNTTLSTSVSPCENCPDRTSPEGICYRTKTKWYWDKVRDQKVYYEDLKIICKELNRLIPPPEPIKPDRKFKFLTYQEEPVFEEKQTADGWLSQADNYQTTKEQHLSYTLLSKKLTEPFVTRKFRRLYQKFIFSMCKEWVSNETIWQLIKLLLKETEKYIKTHHLSLGEINKLEAEGRIKQSAMRGYLTHKDLALLEQILSGDYLNEKGHLTQGAIERLYNSKNLYGVGGQKLQLDDLQYIFKSPKEIEDYWEELKNKLSKFSSKKWQSGGKNHLPDPDWLRGRFKKSA